ncbi:hypothetical protein HDU97_008268, partial [Phlyctochytrium planicorne]
MDVDMPESSAVQMDFSKYTNMAVVNREPLPYSSTVASISKVHPHGLAPGSDRVYRSLCGSSR